MALDYYLSLRDGEAPVNAEGARRALRSEIGAEAPETGFFLGRALTASVFVDDGDGDGEPAAVVAFRLDKFQAAAAEDEMLRLTARILAEVDCTAELTFESDEVLLRATRDGLVLDEESGLFSPERKRLFRA